MCLALALLCTAVVSAIPSPNFPSSFTTNEEDLLAVTQGPYVNDKEGLVCCDPKTSCEVQTQYQTGINYYDATGNRTRFDGGGQIIVTLWNLTNPKQMLVDSNLVCQEYCPAVGDFDPTPFWPDDLETQKTIKNLGNVTINGVECVHYQWLETIIIIIKMQLTDLYVHYPGDGTAIPISQHDVIEPFGQQLGTEDSNWSNFAGGVPDPSLFAVTGIRECQKSSNCNSVKYQQDRLRHGDFKGFLKYHQKQ